MTTEGTTLHDAAGGKDNENALRERPLSLRRLAVPFCMIWTVGLMISVVHVSAQDASPGGEDSSVSIDSLELVLRRIGIEEARLKVQRTTWIRRLIPMVDFTAGLSLGNLLFVDAGSQVQAILPRDSYRLSASLSISGLVDNSDHHAAELELARRETAYELLRDRQRAKRHAIAGLRTLQQLIEQEAKMKEDVLTFNMIRFRQGKIGYDALIRSKLDILNVKKNVQRVIEKIEEADHP